MTDNEIKKALECHAHEIHNITEKILNCCDCDYVQFPNCSQRMSRDALDLINRQQAEIERLTKETMNMAITIETCQAEAIKEFADRLKPKLSVYDEVYVDSLVKKMVGEDETT